MCSFSGSCPPHFFVCCLLCTIWHYLQKKLWWRSRVHTFAVAYPWACRCTHLFKTPHCFQNYIFIYYNMHIRMRSSWRQRGGGGGGAIEGCCCCCCLLIVDWHASVSQGRICSDNGLFCHTETEDVDQTFYLTQSQYTDSGPTSPSANPIKPGAWQGDHRSTFKPPVWLNL